MNQNTLNYTRRIYKGQEFAVIHTPTREHAADSGQCIAETYGPYYDKWAEVFAAAPLMLELLREIVPEHGDLSDLDYEPELVAAMDKARELLRELPNFSHYTKGPA